MHLLMKSFTMATAGMINIPAVIYLKNDSFTYSFYTVRLLRTGLW